MNRARCSEISIAFLFAIVMGLPAHLRAACSGGLPNAGDAATAGSSPDDPTPQPSTLIVTADFNRDGIPDIAKIVLNEGDASAPRSVSVTLGQRDGTYRQTDSAPLVGCDPRTMVVGDFNADGIPDVIVGDGDGALVELLGDGTGNLLAHGEIAHLSSVASLVSADFNHDGILDLAVEDLRASNVTIFLGTGLGSFRPVWKFSLRTQGKILQLATADFNGDGLPDLIVTDEDEETFEVMTGNGNGTFTYAPALSHVKDPLSHCVT